MTPGALALDLAAALDPAVLASRAGLTLDAWQAAVVRSTAPRLLLNCSRQSGKSTTTAVLATHTALYQPGALVLLLSPSLRQSSELFKKCLAAYRAVAETVEPMAESALRLELANGSRIVALPGKEETVRGFSGVSLLVVDEAARVLDDLYFAIRPMLAVSGGRLVALSTPFGKRGWWYDAWEQGGPSWERVRVPATDCPRIDPAFLAEERATLPAAWFAQEYLCAFAETTDSAFTHEQVTRALTPDVAPLFE